jgi:signal transduction histidine kinase/DNA-binding response OmpR family regulator
MNKWLLLILWLFPLLLWGQVDSLRAAWQADSLPATARAEAYQTLIRKHVIDVEPERGMDMAQELQAFARRHNLKIIEGKSLDLQAISWRNRYQYGRAATYFLRAAACFAEVPNPKLQAYMFYWAIEASLDAGQYQQADLIARRSLAVANTHQLDGYVTSSLNHLGIIAEMQGEYEQAVEHYEAKLELDRARDDQQGLAGGLINLGMVREFQGNLAEAVDLYSQGLKISEAQGYRKYALNALNNLGNLHLSLRNWKIARQYLIQALDLSRELGDRGMIAGGLINLGGWYHKQKTYDTAMVYFQQGIALSREINHREFLANGLINLASTQRATQQYPAALASLQEVEQLYQEMDYTPGVAVIWAKYGRFYLAQEEYRQAIAYCERALPVIEANGEVETLGDIYSCLYQAYQGLGNAAQALAMHNRWHELEGEINDLSTQKVAIQERYDYQYRQKVLQDSLAFVQRQAETELAYQSQLNRRNLLLAGAAITLLLGALGFLFFRYRQQQRSSARELELARERERKEQLTELDRLKSQFFANLSHEFRTPLTLILGQNQSLQADIDDPRLDAKFDMLDRNGRRLLELVNQVLDLSKLESGRMELALQTFDLLPFLKNLLFSFESLADQKRQQLIFQSQEDSLLMVADPAKLERVFFNLLSNAVKFTPEGGSITVKLQMVAHRVHVGVLDTGVGISAEQQGQVFDRFYQAQGGANQPAPGTGIGLALAKELVELHRGQIELRSQVGQGSEFWVNLPLSAGVAAELNTPYEPQLEPLPASVAWPVARQSSLTNAEIQISNSQSRILIVEDNPDVRSYLRQELLGLGYQVLEAADGQAGLAQAQAEQPDLIISDVMMPKMDGFELARAIRAEARSSHIPLILLTAKASQESRITGLETGVDAYLTKPFNARELRVRIANLIEQRQLLRQKFAKALTIKPEEVSAVPMDQQFLQTVTATIEAHLGDAQFGVEPLAKAVGMSVTHLNRKLKALVGQSAGKLIRSMRLQRAADLLRQQAGTVSEIAYDLGFGDPTNFGRAFKAQFGVTPGQWGEGIGDS